MGRRRVGKLGEEVLRKLAAEQGGSLTQAGDDRWGWDFLLEFPAENDRARAKGPEEEIYRCLIQVKSTDGDDMYCQVKISNWHRLANTPLPSFFVALHFDGARDCREAYLIHIGQGAVARILKRVRELVVSGEGERLHKHRMILKWSDEDRLEAVSGEALMERIRQVVGKSPADYSEKKLQLWKSIGYEPVNAQATARIIVPPEYKEKHPDELLVDSMLGLVPELELAGGEVRRIRFGIPDASPHEINRGAKLRFEPCRPVMSGVLFFRLRDRTYEVAIRTEVFAPQGIRYSLDRAAQKVLLKMPFSELVIPVHGRETTVHFSLPDWEEEVDLEAAAGFAGMLQLLTIARDASSDLVDIWLDDRLIGTVAAQGIQIPAEIMDWAAIMSMSSRVARSLKLPASLRVTLRSLVSQRNALTMIDSAGRETSSTDITFVFSLDEGSPPDVGQQMAFPIHLELEFGGHRAVVFASMIGGMGEETADSGGYVVRVDRVMIEKVLRLGAGESLPRDRVEYLEEVAEARAEEGGVLCWWRKSS